MLNFPRLQLTRVASRKNASKALLFKNKNITLCCKKGQFLGLCWWATINQNLSLFCLKLAERRGKPNRDVASVSRRKWGQNSARLSQFSLLLLLHPTAALYVYPKTRLLLSDFPFHSLEVVVNALLPLPTFWGRKRLYLEVSSRYR